MNANDGEANEIDRELFRLLVILAHRLETAAARATSGETVMGMLVLQLLSGPKPPLIGRELAETLGCTPPAVAQTLARLERAGMIRRMPGRWDSRTKDIAITAEAREAWSEPISAVMQRATAALSLDEKERLVSLLERFERDVGHLRAMRLWGEGALRPALPSGDGPC